MSQHRYDPNQPQQQPGQQPQQPQWYPTHQAPYFETPEPARPKKSHKLRNAVLGSFAAAVALIVGISVAASGGGKDGQASATTSTSHSHARVTEPSMPPVNEPKATPTAPKPTPVKVLLRAHGDGISNTEPFTADDGFEVHYSYDCSAFGTSGNFILTAENGDGVPTDVIVNEIKSSGSGVARDYSDSGDVHLNVNSECTWSLRVMPLAK